LTISASDQGFAGAGGELRDSQTIPIVVNAVNDPPQWLAPSAQLMAEEDKELVISGLAVQDVDAQSQTIAGSSIVRAEGVFSVQMRVVHGTIKLSSSAGLRFRVPTVGEESARLNASAAGVEVGVDGPIDGLQLKADAVSPGNGQDDQWGNGGTSGAPPQTFWRSVAFSGSLKAINLALHDLTYIPALNWNSQDQRGEDEVFVTVNDLGSSGAGGEKAASLSLGIIVLPVNDVPVVNVPGARRHDEQLQSDGRQAVVMSIDMITLMEDEELPIPGVYIEDADILAGAKASTIELSLQAAHGYVVLESTKPLGLVFMSGSGDGTSAFVKLRANLLTANAGS
jgi:hypothetical protein